MSMSHLKQYLDEMNTDIDIINTNINPPSRYMIFKKHSATYILTTNLLNYMNINQICHYLHIICLNVNYPVCILFGISDCFLINHHTITQCETLPECEIADYYDQYIFNNQAIGNFAFSSNFITTDYIRNVVTNVINYAKEKLKIKHLDLTTIGSIIY